MRADRLVGQALGAEACSQHSGPAHPILPILQVDPTLTRADRLVGQVLGEVGALPDVFTELEINFFLLRRLLGVRTTVRPDVAASRFPLPALSGVLRCTRVAAAAGSWPVLGRQLSLAPQTLELLHLMLAATLHCEGWPACANHCTPASALAWCRVAHRQSGDKHGRATKVCI